jgi:periplasmic protein CpxP/Spy
MIRFRSTIAGAVVAVVLVTGAVFAQEPEARRSGAGRFGGPAGRGLPGVAGLDLTETQQQQIRDVRQRYREELQRAGEQVRQALEARRQAVEAVPINEGAIRATTQRIAEAQAEAAIVQARIHNDVWAVLTPAQQAQAETLKAQRADRLKQRRQQLGERLQRRLKQ